MLASLTRSIRIAGQVSFFTVYACLSYMLWPLSIWRMSIFHSLFYNWRRLLLELVYFFARQRWAFLVQVRSWWHQFQRRALEPQVWRITSILFQWVVILPLLLIVCIIRKWGAIIQGIGFWSLWNAFFVDFSLAFFFWSIIQSNSKLVVHKYW